MAFFATTHGKSPCDGLVGTVKRLATRASLQIGIKMQILTPLDFFKWACQCKSLPNVNFVFGDNDSYLRLKSSLETRFHKLKDCVPVKGTQSLHFISSNAVDLGCAHVKFLSTYTHL